jgi:hypothetical protein
MTSFGNKVFVGLCILVGLLSALFTALTGYMSGSDDVFRLMAFIAVGFVAASGWGVCALVRNNVGKFTMAATLAFAASFIFQLLNFSDAIFKMENPEVSIFTVTTILLIAGLSMVFKE